MKNSIKINRLAIVSFVSGLMVLALLALNLYWLQFSASLGHANTIRAFLDVSASVQYLCAAVALITGVLALRAIQKKDGTEKGNRLAWIGIVPGAGYLLFGLLVTIIFSAGVILS